MSDLIDRQAAIDALKSIGSLDTEADKKYARSVFEALPSAQSEQQHGRIFQEIVVEYPSYCVYPEYKGKPYFSIKYVEDGHYFIGYGTYKPEVLSECLKDYFLPSAQPHITHCAECIHWKHSDVRKNYCEVLDWVNTAEDFCSFAERRTDE